MSPRPIRCFEYINAPYDPVAEALQRDPAGLLARATNAAQSRAESVAVALTVDVGAMSVGAAVDVVIDEVEQLQPRGAMSRVTRISLHWKAAKLAALFPTMKATLSAYPLSPTETQIDLDGEYEPPGGALGAGADALVGRRIAEASVHRLVSAIANQLRTDLAEST